MYIEDFSVSRRTAFEDDFWDSRDSVFIKGLFVRSSLFAQKMSASAVELRFLDDYLGPGS